MDDSYYNLLGVPRSASKDEIKKAYKDIARKAHPDKGGDPEKFKKINEAYGVLSDDELRARYDQFGLSEPPPPFPDFFSMFHPFQHGAATQRRTPNREMNLELTMEESFNGATIRHLHKRKVYTGDANSSSCQPCQGRGRVVSQVRSPFGLVQNMSVCPTCAGVGVSVSEKDFRVVPEVVDIEVPPGTGPGRQFILRGKADEMPKMEPGDIVLTVALKAHPVFEHVGGGDIRWRVRAHPLEALTCFNRAATLPSGEVVGIRHSPNDDFFSMLGRERVLRGKGLHHADGRRGDLLIAFSLDEFYAPDADALYQACQLPPPPPTAPTGTPIAQLALHNNNNTTSHPQQPHFQQPHVQECRPS